MNRIGKRRDTANIRALTNTLCTDRMMRARGDGVVGLVIWCLHSRWYKEIHQCTGGDITLLVIGNFLAHGDRQRFGQSPMNLAFDDHRVDPCPAIIKRIDLPDFGCTRIDINFHDADVGPERIGHVWRVIIADCLKTRLDTRHCLVIGREGDFLHRLEPFRCPFDNKAVDIPLKVIVMHLKQICRNHLRLCTDFAARHCGCRTSNRC